MTGNLKQTLLHQDRFHFTCCHQLDHWLYITVFHKNPIKHRSTWCKSS